MGVGGGSRRLLTHSRVGLTGGRHEPHVCSVALQLRHTQALHCALGQVDGEKESGDDDEKKKKRLGGGVEGGTWLGRWSKLWR